MPGSVWYDPANPRNRYYAIESSDPNVPAGYVLSSGTDGAQDRDQQTFMPGGASGGFPQYPSTDRSLAKSDLQANNGSRSPGASNGPY